MKKFKDLKTGDIVYEASIKDSTIKQNCVGSIIFSKYVTGTYEGQNPDRTGLVLQTMRYDVGKGYVKEDRPEVSPFEERIYPIANASVYTDKIITGVPDEHELLINERIIATNKRDLAGMLKLLADDNRETIENLEKEVKNAEIKSSSLQLNLSIRLSMVQFEPEEKELTEEEFACMAL